MCVGGVCVWGRGLCVWAESVWVGGVWAVSDTGAAHMELMIKAGSMM